MAACPSCGTQNPDGFRLCGMCGTPLAPAGERQERRVVSVLFADLVSFTSQAEHSDVEDVERLLRRYYDTLRGELERHGGLVEKFIGDAVMALFGVPVAHEDDPERAVRAGLAIQDAITGLRHLEEIDLHVRVGVTTGEVLVAWPADGDAPRALGDVVNTAARLQTAAAPDTVIVDQTTREACRQAIVFEGGSPVVAKGKVDRVVSWTAVRALSALPSQTRTQDLSLVGRSEE